MSTAQVPFRTAMVLGASSGIGAVLAKKLAAQGVKVAAVARREAELQALAQEAGPNLLPYPFDLTDFARVPAQFDQIVKDLGGLDLFVYMAGYLYRPEEGEYNFEEDYRMIQVNISAAVCWSNLACAMFEAKRGGVLCGVSSVAGDRGRRGAPVYGLTKAAMNSYMESMRNRLSRYGVRVVTIKPGPVATPMTEGQKMPFMIPADQAGDEILAALNSGTEIAYVPAIWVPIMWVIRNMPSFIFRRTNV